MTEVEKAQIDILRNNGQNITQIASAAGRSLVVKNYINLDKSYGVRTYKKRKDRGGKKDFIS